MRTSKTTITYAERARPSEEAVEGAGEPRRKLTSHRQLAVRLPAPARAGGALGPSDTPRFPCPGVCVFFCEGNAQGPTPWNYKPHCGAFCFVSKRAKSCLLLEVKRGDPWRQRSLLKVMPLLFQGALGRWENHWISSWRYYWFSAPCCLQCFRRSDEETILSWICRSISEV